MSNNQQHNNTHVYDPLERLLTEKNTPTIFDVLHIYEHRTYGFVIFLLAFIIVIPTGIIPGVAITASLFVCIVVIQYAFGKQNLYVPDFVGRRTIQHSFLKKIVEFLKKYDTQISYVMGKEKYNYLFRMPFRLITSMGMICVALSTFPLTFTLFIETVPGLLMTLYGLALIAENGRILVLAWVITVVYIASLLYFIQFITSFF